MWVSIFVIFALATQMVASSHTGTRYECDTGWEYYAPEQKCLAASTNYAKFGSVQALCALMDGAYGVTIKDKAKDDFLIELLDREGITEAIWTGIAYDSTQFQYFQSDGTPVGPYAPWDDPIGTGNCVSRYYKLDSNSYVWKQVDCSSELYYVCEKPVTSYSTTCDSNWVITPDGVTCLKAFKKKKYQWAQAKSSCINKGGVLATNVKTKEERQTIMNTIGFQANFWIGVYSPNNDGIFSDVNGESVDNSAPFKRKHGGSCVSLKSKKRKGGRRNGKWYTRICTHRLYYICQKLSQDLP